MKSLLEGVQDDAWVGMNNRQQVPSMNIKETTRVLVEKVNCIHFALGVILLV